MCIIESKKFQRKETLADLTEEFPVWKVIRKTGHAEYDIYGTQPKLLARRTYKAKPYPNFRQLLSYAPSFHAFLNRKDANDYIITECNRSGRSSMVRKYWMKKADVTVVGGCPYHIVQRCCIAARKITRK